jgi:hypothetical protein
MPSNFQNSSDMSGVIGELGASYELHPRTQSGVGPCDSYLDPTERRIALPGVYATFAVNWSAEATNPATLLTLNTIQRQVGTCGITDTAVTNDLGFTGTLDESVTSLAKDGFFYSDYDFLFHSMGVQSVGPLFLSALTDGGAGAAATNAAVTGALLNGIVPFSDTLQQWLFSAFLASFNVTFSVDSETKCDWLGLPLDIQGGGFGLDGGQAGSNGVAVRGNRADFRVNFRARGGSSNGRDTSKRLVTKFARNSSLIQPRLTLPAGLGINGTGGLVGITQLIRVYFEGCPAPATVPGGAASASNSDQLSALQSRFAELEARLKAQSAAPSTAGGQGWSRY